MIYLASPYSHDDEHVRRWRYIEACRAAAVLIDDGHAVYCPIAHSHGIAIHGGLESDWETFQVIDEYFLGLCTSLMVLKLSGWDTSQGVSMEIVLAEMSGKPIEYMERVDGPEPPTEVDTPGFRRWLQAGQDR